MLAPMQSKRDRDARVIAFPRRRPYKIFGVNLGVLWGLTTLGLAVNWVGDIAGWW